MLSIFYYFMASMEKMILAIHALWKIFQTITSSFFNDTDKISATGTQTVQILFNVFVEFYLSKHFFIFLASRIYDNQWKALRQFKINSTHWAVLTLLRPLVSSCYSLWSPIRKPEAQFLSISNKPLKSSDLMKSYNLNTIKYISVYYFTTAREPDKIDSENNVQDTESDTVENMENDKAEDIENDTIEDMENDTHDTAKEGKSQNLEKGKIRNYVKTWNKSNISKCNSENTAAISINLPPVFKVPVGLPPHKIKRISCDDDRSQSKRLKPKVPDFMENGQNLAEPESHNCLKISKVHASSSFQSEKAGTKCVSEQKKNPHTENRRTQAESENNFESYSMDSELYPKIGEAKVDCEFLRLWDDNYDETLYPIKESRPTVENKTQFLKTHSDDHISPEYITCKSDFQDECFPMPQSPKKEEKTEQNISSEDGLGNSIGVPRRDPNYKPYPGLAENPSTVKKDARYQKRFYRKKKDSSNGVGTSSANLEKNSQLRAQDVMQLEPSYEILSYENNKLFVDTGKESDSNSNDNNKHPVDIKEQSASHSDEMICVRPREGPFTQLELRIALLNSTFVGNVIFYDGFDSFYSEENIVIFVRNGLADHTGSRIPLLPMFRAISIENHDPQEYSMEEFLRFLRIHQERYYSQLYFKDTAFEIIPFPFTILNVPLRNDKCLMQVDDRDVDNDSDNDEIRRCRSAENLTSPRSPENESITKSDSEPEAGFFSQNLTHEYERRNRLFKDHRQSEQQYWALSEIEIPYTPNFEEKNNYELNIEDKVNIYDSYTCIRKSNIKNDLQNEYQKSRKVPDEIMADNSGTFSGTNELDGKIFTMDEADNSSTAFDQSKQKTLSRVRNSNDNRKAFDPKVNLISEELPSLQIASLLVYRSTEAKNESFKENSSPITIETCENVSKVKVCSVKKIFKSIPKIPLVVKISQNRLYVQESCSRVLISIRDSDRKQHANAAETSLWKLSKSVSNLSLCED